MFPIISILAVISLLILLTRRSGSSRKFFYGKRIKKILLGYIALLFVSFGLYYLIPKANSHGQHIDLDHIPVLYDYVYGDKELSDLDEYINNKWEFEYPDEQLHIDVQGSIYSDVLIRIERKAENDGMIEVYDYRTPTIVDESIDVTKELSERKVNLANKTLSIHLPDYTEIQLTMYKTEFPIAQFSKKDWRMKTGGGSVMISQQLLNIRIPKDLQVSGEDYLDIHYAE